MITVTESGDWIAPVAGWYKFHIKGAGGGGMAGGYSAGGYALSGGGGGEGGITIAYEYLGKGDTVNITIGKGGKGGVGYYGKGTDGEDSIIVVNGHSYIGGRGFAPIYHEFGGQGGAGTIMGCSGTQGEYAMYNGMYGNSGGGHGGSAAVMGFGKTHKAEMGGGGHGGAGVYDGRAYAGGDGGDGICWIEFFDPKKK